FCLCSLLRPAMSTLFPYTTLFRSPGGDRVHADVVAGEVEGHVLREQHDPAFACAVGGAPVLGEDPGRRRDVDDRPAATLAQEWRSEEHTSELQSRENLVCRLLLEK